MKIAVMQPYFLPYIGYFQLIDYVDKFIIYDDVHFINKGWINRNNILVSGEPTLITIPLQSASQNKLIKDVHVTTDRKSLEKLLRKIQFSYSKAPFFEPVFSLVTGAFDSYQGCPVSLLNLYVLKSVSEYLGIHASFILSSQTYSNQGLKGQDRILDICRREHALQYINPSGGTELYSKAIFQESGIELSFIKPKDISYAQGKLTFVPNLSILDVLMFNSVSETRFLLKQFEIF